MNMIGLFDILIHESNNPYPIMKPVICILTGFIVFE